MTIHRLDARGLVCPLPVLKARKILLSLPPGDELHVMADDKRAPADFELFCKDSGHAVTVVTQNNDIFEIHVKRSV